MQIAELLFGDEFSKQQFNLQIFENVLIS